MNTTPNSGGPNPEYVRNLFSSIAGGYDRANDVITFGMAHMWRRKLVQWSGARAGESVLDCATGTGDLALEFKRAVGDNGHVVGSDFCKDMLDVAPAKAQAAHLDIDFEVADAMNLPYEDNSFDIVSIAYGIRNVADPAKALSEMARVAKPGGRVMILETGDSQWPLIRTAYKFYFNVMVPRLGGWVTGQRSAYEYLKKSSSQFPSREKFIELMNSTQKFSSCEYKSLMGGASFIYKGTPFLSQ